MLQGSVKWVGDTPAVWHHCFEPLAPDIEPVSMAQQVSSSQCHLQCATAWAGSTAVCSGTVGAMHMLQGYFVDVGAGDGVFNSNTLFLERQRCWKGIAVEPAANEYPKLERHRPGSTVVSSPPAQVPVLQDVASTGTASAQVNSCACALPAVQLL